MGICIVYVCLITCYRDIFSKNMGGRENGRLVQTSQVDRADFLLGGWLLGLLGEEHGLDVGQNTTLGDGHAGQKFVQLLVVADGQLQVTGDDSGLFVVTGCVACQLQHFSGQVLKNGGQVHRGTGSDSLGVVALPQQTVDTTHGELKSGTG